MLRFTIDSFKAIKKAQLELADITVVTGSNATGKSTIAESVAAFVNASAKYRVYVTESFLQQYVFRQFYAFQTFFSKLADDEKFRKLRSVVIESFFRSKIFEFSSLRSQVLKAFIEGSKSCEDILDDIEQVIHSALDVMFQCGEPQPRFVEQLLKDLDVNIKPALPPKNLYDILKQLMEEARKSYQDALLSRQIEYLPSHLRAGLPATKLTVEEEGDLLYPLSNGERAAIGICASLTRAIYLRSPYASPIQRNDGVWRVGRTLTLTNPIISTNLKLDSYSMFLGGDVSWNPQNETWAFTEGVDSYDLKTCATGIRAIADIKKLEHLQALDSSTLLILDEPEAHLHPEWIVRYAGLLVHAVKEYGIHLLIATHSPMMTMALHDIAAKEGLLGQFKCYQTKMEQEMPRQATLIPLGDDIAPIFDQFNQSYDLLERICDEV